MSSVSNPTGPVNPNDPQKQTDPVKPGTDKFKDLMKIDSSAEKQKKRKKRSQETEEEEKAKLQAGPAEPDKTAASKKAEKYPKIQKVGESEKQQTRHGKRSEETTTELAREEAAALSQKKMNAPLEFVQAEKAEKDNDELTKTSIAASQTHKEIEQIFEEEEQLLEKELDIETFKTVAAKKEEAKKETTPIASPSPSTNLGPLFLSPAASTPPAYSLLDAQALALFEKMASVISILKESGVTETTIHLISPEFANSQLYGAQVVIREYSTAPLSYNIEFMGNPLAAQLFQKNLPQLRNAFNDPKYRFRINRLESSISKEDYRRVERKEESSDE